MKKHLYVYMSQKRNMMGELTPIVVEGVSEFSLNYWAQRKRVRPELFWEIK